MDLKELGAVWERIPSAARGKTRGFWKVPTRVVCAKLLTEVPVWSFSELADHPQVGLIDRDLLAQTFLQFDNVVATGAANKSLEEQHGATLDPSRESSSLTPAPGVLCRLDAVDLGTGRRRGVGPEQQKARLEFHSAQTQAGHALKLPRKSAVARERTNDAKQGRQPSLGKRAR